MLRTFNCGLGMVLIVDSDNTNTVLRSLKLAGENPTVVGQLHDRTVDPACEVLNFSHAIHGSSSRHALRKKRVAILISGSGTNMVSLIQHTKDRSRKSAAEIALVISNRPEAPGLKARLSIFLVCSSDLLVIFDGVL